MKDWEVEILKQTFHIHSESIHAHHANEDKIVAPFLRQRFKYPDKVEHDHEELVTQLNKVADIIQHLKEGDSVEPLLTEWTKYDEMMRPHLKEEEDFYLPLMRAYFTREEFAVLVQQIIKNAPALELGGMVHTLGVDYFRSEFMKQEGIPSFVWWLQFRSAHKAYVTQFVSKLEAVEKGERPAASGSAAGCFIL
jgi:hypothetical protein